jgi:hypothetical protein
MPRPPATLGRRLRAIASAILVMPFAVSVGVLVNSYQSGQRSYFAPVPLPPGRVPTGAACGWRQHVLSVGGGELQWVERDCSFPFTGFQVSRFGSRWNPSPPVFGTTFCSDRVVFELPLWVLVMLTFIPMAAWIGRRHLADYLRARRTRLGRCPSCSYNLARNTSGVCPECGRAIAHSVA